MLLRIAETALGCLVLVKNVDVLVEVCFFLIQLLHFFIEVPLHLSSNFLLDFLLKAPSLIAFTDHTLILLVGLYGCLVPGSLNRLHPGRQVSYEVLLSHAGVHFFYIAVRALLQRLGDRRLI